MGSYQLKKLMQAIWALECAPEPSGHPDVVAVIQAAREFPDYQQVIEESTWVG